MPSPAPMERLDALLLAGDARAALRDLGELGTVELLPAGAAASASGTGPAPLGAVLDLAARLRKDLGPLPAVACELEPDLVAARSELETLRVQVEAAQAARAEALASAEGLEAAREALAPFADLPIPSDHAQACRFVRCSLGSIPEKRLEDLAGALGSSALLFALQARAGRRFLALLGSADATPQMEDLLRAVGFEPAPLPCRPGATFEALAHDLAARSQRAETACAAAEVALQDLATQAPRILAAAERAAHRELRLREAERCLGHTESSAFLSGWVPASESGAVLARLSASTRGRCAAQTEPATGEAPVLLRPPRPFGPFALLVTTYGTPRYCEQDPTALAALLYLLMFGMMFGDVGHGGVLAAVGLWLAIRGRARSVRDAGRLVVACGLSSMLFGALYGSAFGLEAFKHWALWRDPIEGDPLSLLLVAGAAGVAILSLGVALNVVNRLRARDRLGALLDRFGIAGLVFYWGALALVSGVVDARLALPAVLLAAACWVAKDPLRHLASNEHGESLGEVLAESAVGAFEGGLLYLSNTVSFVRLAAYAMSHAALLAATWQLAEAAGEGTALSVLAAVAGNAVALCLEGVVAAVQALRLEYYEFFGKFFAGGGRPFRPFSLAEARGEP